MKISLGMKIQTGPWGGGNQFGRSLSRFLQQKGMSVYHDLNDNDLDIILLTEPREYLKSSAFSEREIFTYLRSISTSPVVVHRVNECDERKDTRDVNRRLIRANLCADHTVFVSHWLKDLFARHGMMAGSQSVILNGSDRHAFNAKGHIRWDKKGPLKIITHHWAGHWMKGFDIYARLDSLLTSEFKGVKITFTYVGNLPKGFAFRNANYVTPRHGDEMIDLLRQHHVYLSASRNEPGPNHQNEGASCGLPLLYRESGSLPEYCEGFGVSFSESNFEEKLSEMVDSYDYWADRMDEYPHTADRMCEEYLSLFYSLIGNRDAVVKNRKRWRYPLWTFRKMFA